VKEKREKESLILLSKFETAKRKKADPRIDIDRRGGEQICRKKESPPSFSGGLGKNRRVHYHRHRINKGEEKKKTAKKGGRGRMFTLHDGGSKKRNPRRLD